MPEPLEVLVHQFTLLLNFDPYDHVTIVAMLSVTTSANMWNYLACAECADAETMEGDESDGGAVVSHAHANCYLETETLSGLLTSHHCCLLAC